MVLERLKAAGLSLNPAKCVFCKPEVAYLGFLVNRDSTRLDPAKVEPIRNYPTPKSLKGLRKFQGMASWYRRFIPNYATIAEPLTRLTKKNHKFARSPPQVSVASNDLRPSPPPPPRLPAICEGKLDSG